MKKQLLMVLSLLTTAGGMLVGGELRSVFVYNQDLKLESKGGRRCTGRRSTGIC